ncbi:hypothetical protein V1477_018590, partial [Vespula maculifrons]
MVKEKKVEEDEEEEDDDDDDDEERSKEVVRGVSIKLSLGHPKLFSTVVHGLYGPYKNGTTPARGPEGGELESGVAAAAAAAAAAATWPLSTTLSKMHFQDGSHIEEDERINSEKVRPFVDYRSFPDSSDNVETHGTIISSTFNVWRRTDWSE